MQRKSTLAGNPLTAIMQNQKAVLNERAAVVHEADKELACLVQTKGWLYAQLVANEIQEEFNCKPTDPNWHVYTTVQYALNQFFGRVKKRAKKAETSGTGTGSILAEIRENNASRSRGNDTDAGTSSRTSRRRSAS